MNKIKLSSFLAFALTTYSGAGLATECDVNFNYGVVINPKHIRIVEHGQTRVQINNNKQLFIDGIEQELTPLQLNNLALYSQGIRKQVPEIISIALQGVDLGLKTVNSIIAGLTGENSASHQKIQEKFSEMQRKLFSRFNQTTENYYIAPQDLADFDDIFAGEFEQEIEEIVSASVGTILQAVGEAMTTTKEGDFEQRIETIGSKIENISDDLKVDMKAKSTQLELKTEQFCSDLIKLNQVENKMQKSIPKLNEYDLIEINESNTSDNNQ
jgi:DNA-binding transcriptional regulator GbsR (MarR family)